MLAESVTAVILGGGVGKRLFPLTQHRAKPAVPVGGSYRLVDIPVSNCINSGVLRIFILTQFNSASLNRHISSSYRFGSFDNGFVEVLAAELTPESSSWYGGTADAVRQGLPHIDRDRPDLILILAGDHLYRMDYRQFITAHLESKADITISVTAAREEDAPGFGVLQVDREGRIVRFAEKPKGDALHAMGSDTTVLGLSPEEARERPYLASMGIYVFRKDVLRDVLRNDLPSALDFGGEVIPSVLERYRVMGYLFDDYWEDIGTIRAFYRANMDLTKPLPRFNLFDARAPIYTRPRFLPGAKLLDCQVRSSIISPGCIVNGATLVDSIVGIRARVEYGSTLDGVMLMGADYYQTLTDMEEDRSRQHPVVGIGQHCVIRRAILDKNVRIGSNCQIVNQEGRTDYDGPNYFIRDGIVIIPKDSVIPPGTVI